MLDICRVAMRRNRSLNVSGILYFDGTHFFQTLEGEASAVESVFDSIRRDWRHFAVVNLGCRTIPERRFGGEPMRFIDGDRVPALSRAFPHRALTERDASAVGQVEEILARV